LYVKYEADGTYNLVELLVLLIGIVGEVVVKVVLRDGIYNVVCHISNFIL
jgi:hypothetical protein